jgi:hypothetical protein
VAVTPARRLDGVLGLPLFLSPQRSLFKSGIPWRPSFVAYDQGLFMPRSHPMQGVATLRDGPKGITMLQVLVKSKERQEDSHNTEGETFDDETSRRSRVEYVLTPASRGYPTASVAVYLRQSMLEGAMGVCARVLDSRFVACEQRMGKLDTRAHRLDAYFGTAKASIEPHPKSLVVVMGGIEGLQKLGLPLCEDYTKTVCWRCLGSISSGYSAREHIIARPFPIYDTQIQ